MKSLVKGGAVLADRIVPTKSGITVLIYHRVGGGSSSDVDLDPAVFETQLKHLASHHRVISLDTAITELTDLGPGGTEPAVVLTFDDGTADFTDVAVPILVRNQVPATLYAATAFIDSGEEFPWGAPPTSWSA